jgi:hypothetical protein
METIDERGYRHLMSGNREIRHIFVTGNQALIKWDNGGVSKWNARRPAVKLLIEEARLQGKLSRRG